MFETNYRLDEGRMTFGLKSPSSNNNWRNHRRSLWKNYLEKFLGVLEWSSIGTGLEYTVVIESSS